MTTTVSPFPSWESPFPAFPSGPQGQKVDNLKQKSKKQQKRRKVEGRAGSKFSHFAECGSLNLLKREMMCSEYRVACEGYGFWGSRRKNIPRFASTSFSSAPSEKDKSKKRGVYEPRQSPQVDLILIRLTG